MMMTDEIKCPKCGQPDPWDLDCLNCGGFGQVLDPETDEWEECPKCNGGCGYIEGWYECSNLECNHAWEVID